MIDKRGSRIKDRWMLVITCCIFKGFCGNDRIVVLQVDNLRITVMKCTKFTIFHCCRTIVSSIMSKVFDRSENIETGNFPASLYCNMRSITFNMNDRNDTS